jgi:hypothetical protein
MPADDHPSKHPERTLKETLRRSTQSTEPGFLPSFCEPLLASKIVNSSLQDITFRWSKNRHYAGHFRCAKTGMPFQARLSPWSLRDWPAATFQATLANLHRRNDRVRWARNRLRSQSYPPQAGAREDRLAMGRGVVSTAPLGDDHAARNAGISRPRNWYMK